MFDFYYFPYSPNVPQIENDRIIGKYMQSNCWQGDSVACVCAEREDGDLKNTFMTKTALT